MPPKTLPARMRMKPSEIRREPGVEGLIVLVVTLLMLVSGIPVAFGLGAIASSSW